MNINIFINKINKIKMKKEKIERYIKNVDNGYRFSFTISSETIHNLDISWCLKKIIEIFVNLIRPGEQEGETS